MNVEKRSSVVQTQSRQEMEMEVEVEVEMEMELRRGPWTVEEDLTLMNYITTHGEGRWNSLARCAGLKRTGKSCRLRWLNYLRPDVRRGNITLEEQLLILELHSRWGNRWSKIAQYLPGRTDNEIKNYWRTRVQKHAKQLKCDVNSKQFKDTMRYLWMPRLVERIQAAAAANTTRFTADTAAASSHLTLPPQETGASLPGNAAAIANQAHLPFNSNLDLTSESSGSSEPFATQISPLSDLADYYSLPVNHNGNDDDGHVNSNNDNNNDSNNWDYFQGGYSDSITSPCGYFNQAADFQQNQWYVGGDSLDSLWNVEDIYFLEQQMKNNLI
ncbi:hypothetical protein Nepgr_030431 [Nepenthes gracilis]|uniref:Uncharacterized protein n=1 Tax=Nepenthes gracilis TaxID=150966 RepID=A0AAD3Y467_NEPGR|nr:hypothetical protein Nepgr_030431 [Nepenthes gracilis]